jgi:hypothetical protein
MKKILRLIPLLIIITLLNVKGQSVPSDSLKQQKLISYFFTFQSGTLIGCYDCKVAKEITFSAATIHGIKIGKKLRLGAGAGFDSYSDRQALPMFGSVFWDLFGKNNTVFTQITYGWGYVWKPLKEQEFALVKTRGGEAFSAMVGYRIRYGDIGIALMGGYKFQSTTDYYAYSPSLFIYNRGYQSSSQQTICENMNRLAISLSVGWK